MNKMVRIVSVLLVSSVVGVGSALALINHPPTGASVQNGAWVTNLNIGSPAAGIYVRAVVARKGLFALNRTETIYYTADDDDAGQRLHTGCSYRIEGREMPARWWSITLYGEDHFLIPNQQGVYGYNMKNLTREEDGRFAIDISRSPQGLNWIPSGQKEQALSLSLRCYNPEPVMYEKPEQIELPQIIRVRCR